MIELKNAHWALNNNHSLTIYLHWCRFVIPLVYSIQHYVIKFVSDLLQVGGFLHHVRRFPPSLKLTATI
jgi:hypothetical protein